MNENVNWRWAHWSLGAIAGLLLVIALELWVLINPGPQALAQIPDSGMQRKQMLNEQERMTSTLEQILAQLKADSSFRQQKIATSLDQILGTLRQQTIKVKVVSTDKGTSRTVLPKSSPAGK